MAERPDRCAFSKSPSLHNKTLHFSNMRFCKTSFFCYPRGALWQWEDEAAMWHLTQSTQQPRTTGDVRLIHPDSRQQCQGAAAGATVHPPFPWKIHPQILQQTRRPQHWASRKLFHKKDPRLHPLLFILSHREPPEDHRAARFLEGRTCGPSLVRWGLFKAARAPMRCLSWSKRVLSEDQKHRKWHKPHAVSLGIPEGGGLLLGTPALGSRCPPSDTGRRSLLTL